MSRLIHLTRRFVLSGQCQGASSTSSLVASSSSLEFGFGQNWSLDQQQQRWFCGQSGSKGGGEPDDDSKKKRYGKVGHNVADESYKERVKKKKDGDEEEEESLEKTNYDISKRTRPSGEE